jgi:hypothetical protein
MASIWVEQDALKAGLKQFFEAERAELTAFGSTVNQTFEAFVFASVVNWYRTMGWNVELVHPTKPKDGQAPPVRLKFSTRGRPDGYTRAVCSRGYLRLQVRHGLRVATRAFSTAAPRGLPANVCLDVAVILDQDLSAFDTNRAVSNHTLLTLGEAKHMSAFAELITGFLGLVSEMMPECLHPARPYIGPVPERHHVAPFLYVSGFLYPTAQGLLDTIRFRGFDVDVFDHESTVFGITLPKRVVRGGPRRPAPVSLVSELEVPF